METGNAINTTSNRLLNVLSADDRALLAPHLERMTMALRHVLEPANEDIEHIYFPEDGVASVVGNSSMGEMEVGLIGKEGMTGMMVVLGATQTPLRTYAQIAGSALMMNADQLRAAMTRNPTIRDLFLSYVSVFLIQTSQTAVANAAALLSQRLARWLLMCEDRLTSKHIPITHEFLSVMLGVQRSGVTVVLGELEKMGFIKGERGRVSVLDRPGLIALADGTYGAAEVQYEVLFGQKSN